MNRLEALDLEVGDLNRNALLQEVDGDQEAIFATAGNDGAFQAHELTSLDADAFTRLQAAFGRERNARFNKSANALQIAGEFIDPIGGPQMSDAVGAEHLHPLVLRAIEEK